MEDGPAILNDFMAKYTSFRTFTNFPVSVYALTGRDSFRCAKDLIVRDSICFELISNDFNEEQRFKLCMKIMFKLLKQTSAVASQRRVVAQETTFATEQLDEARLLAEVNTIFLKKGIALALF